MCNAPLSGGRSSGFSLLEVLIGAFLLVIVAAVISLFGVRGMRSLSNIRSRTAATHLAASKMEEVKEQPYALLPLTPNGSYFPNPSPNGACDCGQVNFSHTQFPSNPPFRDQEVSGGITYIRQVCVNKVERPGGRSHCPEEAIETGLKNIVVHVSWKQDREIKSYETESLIHESIQRSPPARMGIFRIRVCGAADPPNGTLCDPAKNSQVRNARVAVYIPGVYVEEKAVTDPSQPVTLEVPAGTGYTLHAQIHNFFPFHKEEQSIAAGEVKFSTAPLRRITEYSARLAGETFIADHLVISKVVAQVKLSSGTACTGGEAGCVDDLTEALELFNPTRVTYTIGGPGGGDVSVVYYRGNTVPEVADFNSSPQKSIGPGSYFLIEGVHGGDSHRIRNVRPDITYTIDSSAGKKMHSGLDAGGGGIRILVRNQVVDSVRWNGINGRPPAPNPDPYGPSWEGPALSSTTIRPAVCTPLAP